MHSMQADELLDYYSVQSEALSAAGKQLWQEVWGVYDLRPDEQHTLLQACREADVVQRLWDELQDAPLWSTDAKGTDVASPLLTELRQHVRTLSDLLNRLKLPDTPGGAKRRTEHTSEMARAAARARWSRRVAT